MHFLASLLMALGVLLILISHFDLRGLSPFGRWRVAGYLSGLLSLGLVALYVPLSWKWLLIFAVPALLAAIGIIIVLSSLVNRSLDPLVPFRPGEGHPWRVEDVSFLIGGGEREARGLLLIPDGGCGAAVCVVHGLGNDRTCYKWRLFQSLLEGGFIVLSFDLMGHGESRGYPLRFPDIFDDVPSAVSYLARREEVDGEHIGVLGISLGGALALRAAAEDGRIRAVATLAAPYQLEIEGEMILKEAFTLFSRTIFGLFREASLYNLLRPWFEASARLEMESGELIGGIGVLESAPRIAPRPLLILNGSHDNIVPLAQAVRIYESARQPKCLLPLEGISHLTMLFSRDTLERAVRWLEENL